MKLIIQVNPETGEVEGFIWDRPGKPPPLIWPKAPPEKRKKKKNGDQKPKNM
jgi:hypothetical protein